jgi:hypothetical protein
VQNHHRAETLGQRNDVGVAQIGADLGQVGAFERTGVQIDERVAVCDHVDEERVRDAGRCAAIGVAGEIAVQVAPVGKIARATPEALDVDDRHADHGAGELVGGDVVHDPAYHLDAVELVAVHGGGQAKRRARLRAVDHEDRGGDGDAFE